MGAEEKVPTDAELAEGYDPDAEPDPPVYDERGNVRPRGTEGARPMSFEERVAIAKKLGSGGEVAGDEPEVKSKPAKRTARKKS